MRTEPRFVKPADYFNYHGVNLDEELQTSANESNKSNIFLMKLEDKLINTMDFTACRVQSLNHLSEYQKECLQKGILTQAEYVLRNGDISTDSGYDLDKGTITSMDNLIKIKICPSAYEFLMNSGIWSRVFVNRPRYNDFR